MRPIVRAALLVAALAVVVRAAAWVGGEPRAGDSVAAGSVAASVSSGVAACPPRTLPDQGACVPVPPPGPSAGAGLLEGAVSHLGDHVPRLPERPADPARYRWPLPLPGAGLTVPELRLEPPSPVAVALAAETEAEVRAVRLTAQLGDAEVLWLGDLVGRTVVTLHTVRAGEGLRTYLLVHGGLDGITAGLAKGANLRVGAPLGTVRRGAGALVLEARELRRGVDGRALGGAELRHPARTIPVDLRNLLELVE